MARGEVRVGPWRRLGLGDKSKISVRFADHEVQVLRTLSRSVLGWLAERQQSGPADELSALTGIRTGHTEPPTSVAMRRLLPDMGKPADEAVDEEARAQAQDFNAAMRSLHEPEVIEAKESAGRVFQDSLPERAGEVVLTLGEAQAWALALNDLRLTLGSILGITPDTPEGLPEGHPHAPQLGVYHWLTALQESLLIAITLPS